MKTVSILSFLAVFLAAFTANAQDHKRTQNWYFGDKAGLSFATNPPIPLTDGVMSTVEGCATISDTAGNLLFYTNGVTVWNKNHQIMENGTELLGRESSTQSALIVPWPGNDSLYYVFTTHGRGLVQPGFRYNVINLHENGGLGRVISKNNLLVDVVCEKLTATHHTNGRDIWVLVHGFPNDTFYAYLLTDKGLVLCPVISKIGSVHGMKNQFGQISVTDAQGGMKLSTTGRYLSVSVFGLLFKTELFRFNTTTGKISDQINIPNTFLSYCSEFSNNDSFLYVVDRNNNIYQYAIYDYSETAVNTSRIILNNYYDDIAKGMQLAPDGKIYVAKHDSFTLDIISNSQNGSDTSLYIRSGQNLTSKSTLGLPNFITSYFYRPDIDFKYQTNCDNDIVHFEGKFTDLSPSPLWNIYKNSILIHSSNQSAFSYTFSDTGDYLVRLVSNGDTAEKTIYIEPKLDLGKDTLLCNQNEIILTPPANFRCINWQDGSGDYNYSITESGTYYVSTYNQKGCLVSDTINILFSSLPEPQISRNGDKLETDSGSFIYQWFYNNLPFDANKHYLIARNTGEYKVQITDSLGCKSLSEPFNVSSLSKRFRDHEWIKVYPNPSIAGNEIVIESDFLLQSVRAFDITGKEVYRKENIEKQLFHLSLPQQGLYILNINNTFNYKLMIE